MGLIQRITASFQARVVYPYTQKNFSRTKYGKQILQYKDKYKNKRCFFIGNGPSLQAKDLDVLQEHGEITFAFNRIYNIFSQTKWRPSFYISQDEKMLFGCKDIVSNLDLPVKFVPIQLKWYYDIDIHDANYFNMKIQPEDNQIDDLLWSNDAASFIYCANTGMYTAAQLAVYMGFTEVYLIGVDHHFRISQNNNGEIVVDDKVKDYFSDNYNKDKDNLYIPNTEKSTYTYIAMKKYCDERNVNVFNATHGGKLEVFSRVDFNSLFAN
ncbi:6-hydroxymethylpterin diphosphokinase MptE-like protein [Anaerostipes faecalis]|uniref:6-hydroxymethylpterin diphosphokinase MptE-like protein n=1 Tax=Anaerostipes faecalis TaxID=2738446 RepID=UPI003F0DFCE0